MAVTTLLGLPIPSMSETVGKTIPDLASAMQMIDEKLGGSRIVDHNLDVVDPPNGYYVRWENGLQIAQQELTLTHSSPTRLLREWAYPATFSKAPAAVNAMRGTLVVDFNFDTNYKGQYCVPDTTKCTVGIIGQNLATSAQVRAYAITIGRWK